MTQSMDVQLREPVRLPDSPKGKAEKTETEAKAADGNARAETARKGSSFLAIIEKMVAGARDSAGLPGTDGTAGTAGRGAGGARNPIVGNGRTGLDEAAEPAGSGKTKGAKNAKTAAKAGTEALLGAAVSKGRTNPQSGTVPAGTEAGSAPGAVRIAAGFSAGAQSLHERDAAAETEGLAEKLEARENDKESGTGSVNETRLQTGFVFDSSLRIQARNAGENPAEASSSDEPTSKIRETKASKKDRSAVIGVVDERTVQGAETVKSGDSALETSVRDTGSGTAEMDISFRNDLRSSGGTGMYRLSDGTEAKAANFQEALSQQLRSNAQDFVRAGQIVLRDHDSGSIRLNLHPETLGAVRINLELNDRKISGRIVVSSKEAYDAFRENLDGISQAFADSGFDTAGFDLSWSGSGSETGGDGNKGAFSSPFYASSIPDVMSSPFSADTETGGSHPSGALAVNVYA